MTAPPCGRRAVCGALLSFSALALLACNRIEERRLPPLSEPTARVERRLLVFGIDGATWSVIDRLFAEGRLPNLARLVREGSRAPLRTLQPTHSPRIWTTLATGVAPEVHGILDFVVKIPGSGRTTLPSSTQRRTAAVWNVLSLHGYRVGVANWWASYPAEPIDGFVISDRASFVRRATYTSLLGLTDEAMAARSQGETHPPELAQALEEILGPPAEPDAQLLARLAPLGPEQLAELRAQTVFSRESRLSVLKFTLLQDLAAAEASLFALRRYQPDVMLHFFAGVDSIEHHFWKFMEPERFAGVPPEEVAVFGELVERYYDLADEVLGRFLAAMQAGEAGAQRAEGEWSPREPRDLPLTVVVVSDHGHEADPRHGTPAARGQSLWASGTHKDAPDGILIVSGASAARGAVLDHPTVEDLTPTLLAFLGVPVGADMSGRVLREAIEPAFLAAHPLRTVASHTRADHPEPGDPVASAADELLEGRLRALGYVE